MRIRMILGGALLLISFLAILALLGAYSGNRTIHDSPLAMLPAITALPAMFLFLFDRGLQERRDPDPDRAALQDAPWWARFLVLGALLFALGGAVVAGLNAPDGEIERLDGRYIVYRTEPDRVYVDEADGARLDLPPDDAIYFEDIPVVKAEEESITTYTEISETEYNRRDLYAYRYYGGLALAFNLLPGVYFWYRGTQAGMGA